MNKKLVTEIVIKELPDDHPDKLIPLDKMFFKYWYTGRNSDVLRLTKEGYFAFKQAGIQEYAYTINLPSLLKKLNNIKSNQITLKLGKLLECPWYLSFQDQRSLVLYIFDSKVAMMINLYGSAEDYLQLKL